MIFHFYDYNPKLINLRQIVLQCIEVIMNDNVFLLAYNGPYLNRGCEAITRGTVKILEAKFQNPEFLAISAFACDRDFKKQAANESDARISHKKLYPSGKAMKRIFMLQSLLYLVKKYSVRQEK